MTTALATIPAPAGPLALVPALPTLSFSIPAEDAPEFWSADYSDKVRAEVRRWLHVLARVATAGKAARTRAMQAEARIAVPPVSFGSVRAKWYAYDQSGGDWRVLVKRSLKGSGRRQEVAGNLPVEFIARVARIMANNKRSRRRAYVELVAQWRRWRRHGLEKDAIPGYRTAPEADAMGRYPSGWSYRNLVRFKAPAAEEAITRIGTVAAKEFLPKIPGTRVGLRWLEYVMFDDVWRNREIVVRGLLDPCRLLQLGCLDFATGYYLKFGLRPEVPASDERRERLKKVDMMMLVAAFLAEYGYPLGYRMHLVLERGTATLYKTEAKALYDYTGGQVVCCYTEMGGQLVAAWDEKRQGNPRGKGALESWHNLLHNWEAGEIGNVGTDRDRAPAVLDAQRREARQLNQLALVMTPEQRAGLRFPFASFEEAHARTLEIVDAINDREDHECEGFDTVILWRLKGVRMDWQPEATATQVPPGTLLEYLPVIETPRQRMLRLSNGVGVATVTGSLLRSFLEDARKVKPIERGTFAFKYEGRQHQYLAPCVEDTPPEGTILTGHFSPMDMSVVHLTDADGRFLGTWQRFEPVRRGDAAAHAEGQRVRGRYLAHAVANSQRRHAPDIAAERARMDGNLVIAADAGLISMPTARTLARVESHLAADAGQLDQALAGQRDAAVVAAEKRRAAREATSPLSARDFLPRTNTHPDNGTAPVTANDEGCWIPEPDQTDSET